jgi:cytochrome c oxidase assembly protein subunit 15
LAVVLACATFPLVWVGGLVTTTDAGMAVPDWPTTYGYNLFLYPWQTWLFGPWDLFIEHGHRLLASAVGMLTIGLLVMLLRFDTRRWMKGLGFFALALVIFQGVLGGVRVLFDERTLALLHGCTGPLFFATTVAIVVFTSRTWVNGPAGLEVVSGRNVRLLAIVTAVLAYLQIMVGAVIRHVPVDAQPTTFLHAVKGHLYLAAVLTIHVVVLVGLVKFYLRRVQPISRLAGMLGTLIGLQLALGAGTWVVKFAVPAWAAEWITVPRVQEGSWLQTNVITAHVAIGSLILVTSVALALYAQRLLVDTRPAERMLGRGLEAAV